MKKLILITAFVMAAFAASAAEMGFKGGIFQSYNGSAELFSNQDASLEGASTPMSVFVQFDKLRVSYMQYSQHASDKYSSGSVSGGASILLNNTVLSLDYLADLGDSSSGLYGGAGLGLFRSQYVIDVYASDATTLASLGGTLKSDSTFDIGFILIGGAKKKIGNGFVGAELNYIAKEIQHSKNEAGSSDPDKIDIGGILLMLTTGVAF